MRLLFACALWLIPAISYAQVGQVAMAVQPGGTAFTGIADCSGCMGTPTLYYGLRAYSATEAAATPKAVNVRTPSGSANSDILILSNGGFDSTTATTNAGGAFSCTSATAVSTNVLTVSGCSGTTPIAGAQITAYSGQSSGSIPFPAWISASSIAAGSGTLTVQAGLNPGNFSIASATSLTVIGPIFVTKVYARGSGAATGCAGSTVCDVAQATAGQQPELFLKCNGTSQTLPCISNGTNTSSAALNGAATNYTLLGAGLMSLSTVAARATSSSAQSFLSISGSGNNISGRNGVSNRWNISSGSVGGTNVVASDNAWHAGNVEFLAAGSGACTTTPTVTCLNLDGTDTATASSTLDSTVGKPGMLVSPVAGTTVYVSESALWDNVTSTAAQRVAEQTNEKAYWGTP